MGRHRRGGREGGRRKVKVEEEEEENEKTKNSRKIR